MALAWAAHHWKYCFREQRSLVTFAYNCAHIVPRNLVNRVVGAHFSFIVLKQRNHEVKLPLARPHCPAMAGRRRVAEPAGVVPNTAPRWQAQKWSHPSRYVVLLNVNHILTSLYRAHDNYHGHSCGHCLPFPVRPLSPFGQESIVYHHYRNQSKAKLHRTFYSFCYPPTAYISHSALYDSGVAADFHGS